MKSRRYYALIAIPFILLLVALFVLGGETNLSVSLLPDRIDIVSSTGDDIEVPAATVTEAGVLSAADKVKLDAITRSAGGYLLGPEPNTFGSATSTPATLADAEYARDTQAPDADWLAEYDGNPNLLIRLQFRVSSELTKAYQRRNGSAWENITLVITGPEGPIGHTGAQGATGPQGVTGMQGPTGASGDGSGGGQGAQGIQGNPGPQGPPGRQGATGPAGQKGDQGDDGPPGADANPNQTIEPLAGGTISYVLTTGDTFPSAVRLDRPLRDGDRHRTLWIDWQGVGSAAATGSTRRWALQPVLVDSLRSLDPVNCTARAAVPTTHYLALTGPTTLTTPRVGLYQLWHCANYNTVLYTASGPTNTVAVNATGVLTFGGTAPPSGLLVVGNGIRVAGTDYAFSAAGTIDLAGDSSFVGITGYSIRANTDYRDFALTYTYPSGPSSLHDVRWKLGP